MISSKKLIKMARKWQKLTAIHRKRISFPRNKEDTKVESCSTSKAVDKGHFVVYTADQRRFVMPFAFLRKLLEMSEAEFGLPSDGPITLPCDAVCIEYIISLISQGIAGDLQKAWLISVAASCCSSSSLHQEWRNGQLQVY